MLVLETGVATALPMLQPDFEAGLQELDSGPNAQAIQLGDILQEAFEMD